MQFTDWSVQARTEYGLHIRFGPYTILEWTIQSINCHIVLKAMFYLLNSARCNVGCVEPFVLRTSHHNLILELSKQIC